MKEIFNKLYKILIVVMVFIWGIITFSSCFAVYGHYYNPLAILFGGIILSLIIYNVYNLIKKINPKYHDKIALGMFLISLAVMLFWGLNNEIVPAYDLSHIIAKTDSLLKNNHFFGSDLYFSIYPTQIPLTIFIYGIKFIGSIFNITNLSSFVIIYNAIMTSLMIFCIYKIVKKLSSSHIALIVMLLAVLYPDFYLYVSYYYTDIIALPFGIIGFYLLLKGEETKSKKSAIYYLIAGILFGIGFKLRVTTIILLIAYIICLLRKFDLKMFIKSVLIIISGILISLLTYNCLIYPSFNVEIDENVKVPALHWVMMGTNPETDGGYIDADIIYSIFSENKNEDIKNVIKERIPKLNPKFYYNKLRKVWSEGDHDIQRKYALTKSMNESRLYVSGQMNGILRYYSQILKFTIYTMFLITIFSELSRKKRFEESKNAPLIVAIFGAILFYLLWEALSRYSFSFLPIIIIGSYKGIEIFTSHFRNNKFTLKDKTYNLLILKRIFGIGIILATVIGLLVGYKYATKDIQTFELERNLQKYSTRTYEPLYNCELKEVFRVSKSFNRIQLKVMTNNVTRDLHYIYEVYTKDNKLIYQNTYGFDPKNENILRKITLYVPTVKVNEETEFYVRFYSLEATKDNYIKVNTHRLQNIVKNDPEFSPENIGANFDINPNSETYFNNELYDGSLFIRVFEKVKKPYLESKTYITISIIAIIVVSSTVYLSLLKKDQEK